jgi:hypothetical protein
MPRARKANWEAWICRSVRPGIMSIPEWSLTGRWAYVSGIFLKTPPDFPFSHKRKLSSAVSRELGEELQQRSPFRKKEVISTYTVWKVFFAHVNLFCYNII